jgi:hypothetical protein
MLLINLGQDVSSHAFKAEFVIAILHTKDVLFSMVVQTDIALNDHCQRFDSFLFDSVLRG